MASVQPHEVLEAGWAPGSEWGLRCLGHPPLDTERGMAALLGMLYPVCRGPVGATRWAEQLCPRQSRELLPTWGPAPSPHGRTPNRPERHLSRLLTPSCPVLCAWGQWRLGVSAALHTGHRRVRGGAQSRLQEMASCS